MCIVKKSEIYRNQVESRFFAWNFFSKIFLCCHFIAFDLSTSNNLFLCCVYMWKLKVNNFFWPRRECFQLLLFFRLCVLKISRLRPRSREKNLHQLSHQESHHNIVRLRSNMRLLNEREKSRNLRLNSINFYFFLTYIFRALSRLHCLSAALSDAFSSWKERADNFKCRNLYDTHCVCTGRW